MMWNCPKLVRYWREVTSLTDSVFTIRVDLTPLTCVLGYVEDLAIDRNEQLAVARILYMAQKVLAFHWLDNAPPTLRELVNKVNCLLLLDRGVYLKRGSPNKFEALWAKWLDTPGLASAILTRSRLPHSSVPAAFVSP